jgi:hypothetical protein
MSSYKLEYENLKKDMIQSYFDSLNEKEKFNYIELNAAIVFQKYARRLICRKRFLLLKNQALEVQKALRGYLSRANHQKEVEEQNDNLMTQFYKYHVSIIQKHWEGYKCRKNVMDYYANKRWLAETKKKNEQMLNEMRELTQKKQYELDRQKEENERRNFINIAKNLHHLISTKEIPGVYNTPYLPAELKPQVYNADIEEHLKSIFKSNLRKNKLNNNNNKNVIGSQNSISTMNSNSLRGSKNSAVPEQY